MKSNDLKFDDDFEEMPLIHVQILKLLKRRKQMIMPQFTKAIPDALSQSIRCDLTRLLSDRMIQSEKKNIRLKGMSQFRVYAVYSLTAKGKKL